MAKYVWIIGTGILEETIIPFGSTTTPMWRDKQISQKDTGLDLLGKVAGEVSENSKETLEIYVKYYNDETKEKIDEYAKNIQHLNIKTHYGFLPLPEGEEHTFHSIDMTFFRMDAEGVLQKMSGQAKAKL